MRMLCFGDSNTYGYDPRGCLGGQYSEENRWVDLLTKQTNHRITNAGINGRLIPDSSYSLRLLNDHSPVDVFMVMLGTNDLLQGATAKEAATKMEAFLRPLLPHRMQVLLAAPPPMKRGAWVPTDELVTESIRLAEKYKTLAEKLNISFVDTQNWDIELAFDGVHFTETGHHTFANQLATYLSQTTFTAQEEEKPIIKYDFIEHYYIANKNRYESILCELINLSSSFRKIGGGTFEQITRQNNSQPDVVATKNGYSLDFKMMISQSLAEFRNLSMPNVVEMLPGVRIHQPKKKIEQKAVIFPNAIRDITEDQLQTYRQGKDKASKSIVHFFDEKLNIPKHVLLFLPLYVSTLDKTLPSNLQFEQIKRDFSDALQYLYSYRNSNQPGLDTFFVYIVKIHQMRKFSFVITQFTDSGLHVLDTIEMFSLNTVQQLYAEFS